jgi:hypothetical protein
MKWFSFLLAAFSILSLCAAAVPKDGVLYYNSFNSLEADYAAGDAKPLNATGAKIVPDGKIGNGFMQDGLGAFKIAARGNINPQAGTIAMWVKPVNWNGNDGKFHNFFTVGALKTGRRTFQLYKYYNGHLMILARNPEVSGNLSIYESKHFVQWKAGEWHHLAFSWSKADNRTVLYCDGEPMIGPYKEEFFPQTIEHLIDGITFNSIANSLHWDENNRTIMDEIYIFDYAIGDGGVDALMHIGVKDKPPMFTVPKITRPPKIDGIMAPGEYDEFFSTNTFVETGKAGFYNRETRLFVAYDNENLYVTTQSRTKGGDQNIEILAQRTKRDSEVWLDDAVEVLVMSSDKTRFQLVCNSIGTIYDSRNGNPKYDGKYEVANLISGIWWVNEMILPFKELGMNAPQPGERWLIHFSRDWKNPFVFVSLADTADFHDPSMMPRWVFGDTKGTASVRLDIEKIQAQQVDLTIMATGTEKAALEASVYSITHAGAMTPLQTCKVAANDESKIQVDLSQIDMTQYQNKLGFAVTRADGTILQKSEFSMRTYPPMQLNAALLSAKKSFFYTIDISGLAAPLDKVALECEFLEDGKTLKKWTIDRPEGRILTGQISPTTWNDQHPFALKVIAIDKNSKKSLLTKQYDWKIPAPEVWRNTEAGIDHTVPPPWIPMSRDKNAVRMWNREYRLQASGLPETLLSGGTDLLSHPMKLVVSGKNDKILRFSALQYLETEREDEIKFQSEASDDELIAVLTGKIEFDGFSWYDLKIRPLKTSALLKKVQLRYAMPQSEINYAQLSVRGSGYADLVKSHEIPQTLDFSNQILLGNDYRALAFFMENDRYYYPEHRKDVISIIQQDDTRIITVNMVSDPLVINGEVQYGFGWQAAPVKPLPSGWRSWIQHYRGRHNKQSKLFQIWSWSRWYGFLRPISEKELSLNLKSWTKNYPNMIMQPYFCQYILSMISEEYKLYGVEWSSVPRMELMEFGPRYPGKSVVACIGAKTYADFWLHTLKDFLDDYPEIDGCYWDSIDPRTCENEAHDHGYRDSKGVLCPTTDILNVRNFYKRAYKILKQKHPDAIITGHSSARRNLPTFAFCDVVYDGEQFVSRVSADPDYTNILSDNYCRGFFGTQFGIVPMLMPAYYNNEKMATTELHPTETIYLHSLVYGFIVHSHRINNDVTDKLLDITLPFGIGDAEFIPPYENEAQAKIIKLSGLVTDDVRMGIYRNKGKLLVAVGNFGTAEATPALTFPDTAPVMERRSGKQLGNGPTVSVTIAPHNFVLLEQ